MATRKFKNYQDYLKSDKWAQVKKDYAEMNPHEDCLLCGCDRDLHHHHFTYPSDWNNDSFENLVKICSECHEYCHNQEKETFNSLIEFISYVSPLLIMDKEQAARDDADDISQINLWHFVDGDFSIVQCGISNKKFMDVKYRISNKNDIAYFEKRRDLELSKKDLK